MDEKKSFVNKKICIYRYTKRIKDFSINVFMYAVDSITTFFFDSPCITIEVWGFLKGFFILSLLFCLLLIIAWRFFSFIFWHFLLQWKLIKIFFTWICFKRKNNPYYLETSEKEHKPKKRQCWGGRCKKDKTKKKSSSYYYSKKRRYFDIFLRLNLFE